MFWKKEKEKLVLQIQDLEAEKKDMEKQQVQAAEQKENQEEQRRTARRTEEFSGA